MLMCCLSRVCSVLNSLQERIQDVYVARSCKLQELKGPYPTMSTNAFPRGFSSYWTPYLAHNDFTKGLTFQKLCRGIVGNRLEQREKTNMRKLQRLIPRDGYLCLPSSQGLINNVSSSNCTSRQKKKRQRDPCFTVLCFQVACEN